MKSLTLQGEPCKGELAVLGDMGLEYLESGVLRCYAFLRNQVTSDLPVNGFCTLKVCMSVANV